MLCNSSSALVSNSDNLPSIGFLDSPMVARRAAVWEIGRPSLRRIG